MVVRVNKIVGSFAGETVALDGIQLEQQPLATTQVPLVVGQLGLGRV
jgi:hypothetical protein